MENASAFLSLVGTLSNILAMISWLNYLIAPPMEKKESLSYYFL